MSKSEFIALSELLARWADFVRGTDFPRPPTYEGPDVLINGFVEHSDRVEAGKCFVARVRTGSDGHPYIGRALSRNASLIVGQRDPDQLSFDFSETPYLQVPDSALAEAWLSAAFHEFPGWELITVGVTGTDGKTSTVNLLHAILEAAGLRAGMLSTIKASLGSKEEPLALHVTTPEAPVVQAYLRRMVDAGLSHCVIEATSHGLAQHRLDAIEFDVAVITNITHEHLDYHGDQESYFQAKARLFRRLAWGRPVPEFGSKKASRPLKTAVLNRDDGSYERLVKIAAPRRLTYALERQANFTAADIRFPSGGTSFTLLGPQQLHISTPLMGRFNIYNMLAAAAAAHALGVDSTSIRAGLESVDALQGRMQPVECGQDYLVMVDFAHTPNALEEAIRAGRELTSGKIVVVFGSAGKRDRSKRRWMARISTRLADMTVLTAEDPRTESLNDILEEMAEGCRDEGGVEGTDFWRVPDRGRAIFFALGLARPGDLVLICGKGHEQSMCFGVTEYPWDDVQATRVALEASVEGRPMPDLGLPTFAASS